MGPHQRAGYSSAFGWPALARSDQLKHIRVSQQLRLQSGSPRTCSHLCQSALVSAVSIQFVRLVSHACELTLNAFEAGLPVARWYI